MKKFPKINSIAALRKYCGIDVRYVFQVWHEKGAMIGTHRAIEYTDNGRDSCLHILDGESLYHYYDGDCFDSVASTLEGFQLLKKGKVVREYKFKEAYDNKENGK